MFLFVGPSNACDWDSVMFIANPEVVVSCACETTSNAGKNCKCLPLMSRARTNRGKLLISTCAKHGRGDITEGNNGFSLPS